MLNQDVLLDFFLTFARCEFALKTGGFAKGSSKRGVGMEAQANWDAFAHALPTGFRSSIRLEAEAACERLIDTQPWEFVLVNEDGMWQQQARPAAGNLAADALTAVRWRRNNLFHGNEAGAAHGYGILQEEIDATAKTMFGAGRAGELLAMIGTVDVKLPYDTTALLIRAFEAGDHHTFLKQAQRLRAMAGLESRI
jgi:hypothetical protein